jgi:catalase
LRYESGYEHPEEGEAATTAALIETLEGIQRTVQQDSGHAERAVHAKSHGILRGELRVFAGLPETLAQGLFAHEGDYPVILRFSTLPDVLDDRVSTPRGLALKVIGVEGERLGRPAIVAASPNRRA